MYIFFNDPTAAGRAKKISGIIALMLCCIMALNITVSAAASNKIEFKSSGSEVKLVLDFPQAAAEEIASMQISLSVKTNSDKASIEFVPDSSLAAKIVESRFHSDTGVLNIYIAGTKALFSSSAPLTVGSIKINTVGNGTASATVEIIKDSVKFVRGSELVSPDSGIVYPDPAQITVSQQSVPSVPSVTKPEQIAPAETAAPPVSDNTPDVPKPDTQESSGGNINPADTSALLHALSVAEGYDRESYTESSYAVLTEAVNKARELLSDPYVTQESIDEALLVLENAIGMLTLKNDIPSGAENSGTNSVTGSQGENDSDNSSSAEITGENGETATLPQDGRPSDGSQSQGEKDGSLLIWIIVLIVLATAIAAVAVILALKSKGKKTAKGKHTK